MALSAQQLGLQEMAGESVQSVLTLAPGNGAPIGGLKVTTASGWMAARPSGTENVIKIYAERFQDERHLRALVESAQAVVKIALAAAPQGRLSTARTDRAAVEVWDNEGDPN